MISSPIHRYKSVQVKTCTPGELLVMLYDGLLRYLNEAHTALVAVDRARFGERLDRAMAILSELVSTLRHNEAPDLCQHLEGVYHFCMDHLVQANIDQDADKVNEVIRVLTPLAEGWREAARLSATELATGVNP